MWQKEPAAAKKSPIRILHSIISHFLRTLNMGPAWNIPKSAAVIDNVFVIHISPLSDLIGQ